MISSREISDAIYHDVRLSGQQIELLRVLLDERDDKDGTVTPLVRQLMAHFNIGETAVRSRIDRVTSYGYLREVGTQGRQRVYAFTLPDLPTDVAKAKAGVTAMEAIVATLQDDVRSMGARLSRLEAELNSMRNGSNRFAAEASPKAS